jgi:hypothetical protein
MLLVGIPSLLCIPLPLVDAVLPENVQLIKFTVDSLLNNPPPRLDVFCEKRQFINVAEGVEGILDCE